MQTFLLHISILFITFVFETVISVTTVSKTIEVFLNIQEYIKVLFKNM